MVSRTSDWRCRAGGDRTAASCCSQKPPARMLSGAKKICAWGSLSWSAVSAPHQLKILRSVAQEPPPHVGAASISGLYAGQSNQKIATI
jgi:hypothetical protein